jgi:cytochrome P450
MNVTQSQTPLELGANPYKALLEIGRGHDAQSFRLGKRKLLLLNHPELIEWAFTSPKLGRARFVRLFARFVGEGLMTQDGETHLNARRVMQKAFTRETMPGFIQAIERAANQELNTWSEGPLELNVALTRVSQCATLQSLFGLQAIPDQAAAAQLFGLSSGMAMGLNVNLDGYERRNGRMHHPLAEQTMEFVMNNWQPTAVVQQLLQFEGQARYDQTFAVLVAGFETSASGIVWLFDLLCKHPKVLEALTAGVRTNNDPQQIHRLKYLQQVLQETLRLYPVAGWLNSREVREPVTVAGETLEPGTQLVISSWLTHRDARYFANPDQFLPERFEEPQHPWQYFPFGGGVHQCLGSSLGAAHIMLIAALVLRRFDITAHASNLEPGLTMSITPTGELQAAVQHIKEFAHA